MVVIECDQQKTIPKKTLFFKEHKIRIQYKQAKKRMQKANIKWENMKHVMSLLFSCVQNTTHLFLAGNFLGKFLYHHV